VIRIFFKLKIMLTVMMLTVMILMKLIAIMGSVDDDTEVANENNEESDENVML
jgi:hypothetical protein